MIKDYFTRAIGRTEHFLRKNSSKIAFGVGVVGYAASLYFTFKNADSIKRDARLYSSNKEQLKKELYDGAIDKDQYDYELKDERIRTAKNLAKASLPIVATGAVSMAGFGMSYKIQQDTISGLALALASMTNAYNAKECGEDEVPKDSEGRTIETPFLTVYDSRSANYSVDPGDNILNLKAAQKLLNINLTTKGILYLNEVMDTLGLPRVPCGFEYGWVYNSEEKNTVDLGLFDENMLLIDKTALSDGSYTNGILIKFQNLKLINHDMEENAYDKAFRNQKKINDRKLRKQKRELERYIKEHEEDFLP